MDEIVNTFLLAGDKDILEMHFRRPRFTYSACGPFNRSKEHEASRCIYQNELDRTCFQHDMAYRDFKDLL